MTTFPLPTIALRHCEDQVRKAICPHCSRREGEYCEHTCPLLQALPVLLWAAGRIDPMLADRHHAIRSLIAEAASGQNSDSPLRRHRRRLARVIEEGVAF